MTDAAPPIPESLFLAVAEAAGERDGGWNARFVRALEARGLALVPGKMTVLQALLRRPFPITWAPEPAEADGMTLSYHHPSMIVWAVDVPRRLPQ